MLHLHSVGHFHPENVIDNKFLESLDIGTTREWIIERTGIRSRSTALPLDYIFKTRNCDPRCANEVSRYSNCEMGFRAASMALERAGLGPKDIGMVVAGSSVAETTAPAEACVIADRIGITAPAIDIYSGCSTFAVQLHLISMMDEGSLPDFILIVNPENLTRAVDYNDRGTAVLFGDCTTAAVVSKRVRGPAFLRRTLLHSDPSRWKSVVLPTGGHIRQDGAAVQKFGIRAMLSLIKDLGTGLCNNPYFVGHQANLLMLRSVSSLSEIGSGRHLYNVDRYGNCGAAGAPSVISQQWDLFKPGDTVLIAVVGAGLTWAGLVLDFSHGESLHESEAGQVISYCPRVG